MNHEKLLQKAADQFAKSTSLTYHECLSVMNEAYTITLERFDQTIGEFSTLFYAIARTEMTRELRRHIKDNGLTPQDFDCFYSHSASPDERLKWMDVLNSMTPDAIQLANEALNFDFDGLESNLPKLRKALRQHMRDRGWKDRRIRQAWTAIREALNS